jgi:hypothetical protein
VPRGSLKSLERIERRQPARHLADPDHEKTTERM